MTYDPERHRRRSIRLRGYDYTRPGAYFVTICVQGGACVLGEVAEGQMVVSDAGQIVEACWTDLPNHYPHVQLDAFVVMPNHVHGVIVLVDQGGAGVEDVGTGGVGAGFKPAPTGPGAPASPDAGGVGAGFKPAPTEPHTPVPPTNRPRRHGLPEIVRAWKTFSARRINELYGTPGQSLWQRNYYEHIVRNERELHAIREYIVNNPLRWELGPGIPWPQRVARKVER